MAAPKVDNVDADAQKNAADQQNAAKALLASNALQAGLQQHKTGSTTVAANNQTSQKKTTLGA